MYAFRGGIVLLLVALVLLSGCPEPPPPKAPDVTPAHQTPATDAGSTGKTPAETTPSEEPADPASADQPDETVEAEPAVETDGLRVVRLDGEGEVLVQEGMGGWDGDWSDDEQLLWLDIKPGETLALEFEAPEAGEHEVVIQPTDAPDYGKFSFTVDEGEPGEVIDFYQPTVQLGEEIVLGPMELDEGLHTLTITAHEQHQNVRHDFRMGIDHITVR